MTTATKAEGATDARAAAATGSRAADATRALADDATNARADGATVPRAPRGASASRARLRAYAVVVACFLLATWLTDAWFMGDTAVYARSILNYDAGFAPTAEFPFWEFGHLLWRPVGWLAFRATRPLTALAVGDYPVAQLTLALMGLNWAAGLASAVAFRALVARLGAREWAANVAAVGFVFANAFLNYAQTGCSYVPGLAFFLLGLYFLAPRGEGDGAAGAAGSRRDAIYAGGSLAASVCLWFPYVLVVPGALALPLLVGRGGARGRWRFAFEAAAVAGVLTAGAYLLVGVALVGLRGPAGFLAWMTEASHGYRLAGLPRLVFGFARSFVHMGQDGLMFKRYLLRDPFSPVSLADLLRLSLWKLGLFYLALAAAGAALLRTPRGRRVLAWALAQIVPVFLFALLLFESGMPERYLPLAPAVFACFALALSAGRGRAWLVRAPVVAFAAAVVVSDFGAMRAGALEREQARVFARINDLHPRLAPSSLVAVVSLQDEVSGFYHNFPLHDLNRRGTLRIYSVTEPGSERNLTWRQDFADKVLTNWQGGGDVWLSKRLFAERPLPGWNWAEGDDPRIAWADLRPLFSQVETADEVGGADGFALLARNPRNEEFLRRVAREPRRAKE